MVFRIEARIIAIVMLTSGLAAAETYKVRHRHLHGDGPGNLVVTAEGISFTEPGKHAEHSRVWKYEKIQQLELSETTLSILTYEDQKWQPGRDRSYLFVHLPEGFAGAVYPMWRDKLDQRFIAALADDEVNAVAEFPAKLTGVLKGVEGTLLFGEDRILFRAGKSPDSRTWRFSDIDNIASAGPFDLSIVTFERQGVWKAPGREFRFQLQRPMEEARFNEIWRKVTTRP